MKTERQSLAFPFVLLAIVGVAICLTGVLVMTVFGAIADFVEGEK